MNCFNIGSTVWFKAGTGDVIRTTIDAIVYCAGYDFNAGRGKVLIRLNTIGYLVPVEEVFVSIDPFPKSWICPI